jgi:hypothetical protein
MNKEFLLCIFPNFNIILGSSTVGEKVEINGMVVVRGFVVEIHISVNIKQIILLGEPFY